MKDIFFKSCRGHQFEFTRVLASSNDPWYHITVTLDSLLIKYRMHSNKEGIWKIMTERLPMLLYSLEGEFNDFIKLNEKPTDNM